MGFFQSCTNGIIETPPVSPEIKPVPVNGSAPVNILVIDSVPSTSPSATVYPLSSTNCNGTNSPKYTCPHVIVMFCYIRVLFLGRRLVPVTPLRSQSRKNCIIKVPLHDDKPKVTSSETNGIKNCDKGAVVNKIPLSIAPPPNNTDLKNNLLVTANKPVTLLSANQVLSIFKSNDSFEWLSDS